MQSPPEQAAVSSKDTDNFVFTLIKSLPGGALAGGIMSWWLTRIKARSDAVICIRDLQDELASEVHLYWSREVRDATLESNIVRLNKKFVAKAKAHVSKYGTKGSQSDFKTAVIRLNTSLTGTPFGSKEWARQTNRSVLADKRIAEVMKFIE